MAKLKKTYVCQECGYEAPRWLGKCPSCNEWNTMVEEIENRGRPSTALEARGTGVIRPVTLEEVALHDEIRDSTGLEELDRVLGGGVVKGSLILIGGDPGIGKSTLILQICQSLGGGEAPILYVSGRNPPDR